MEIGPLFCLDYVLPLPYSIARPEFLRPPPFYLQVPDPAIPFKKYLATWLRGCEIWGQGWE